MTKPSSQAGYLCLHFLYSSRRHHFSQRVIKTKRKDLCQVPDQAPLITATPLVDQVTLFLTIHISPSAHLFGCLYLPNIFQKQELLTLSTTVVSPGHHSLSLTTAQVWLTTPAPPIVCSLPTTTASF